MTIDPLSVAVEGVRRLYAAAALAPAAWATTPIGCGVCVTWTATRSGFVYLAPTVDDGCYRWDRAEVSA